MSHQLRVGAVVVAIAAIVFAVVDRNHTDIRRSTLVGAPTLELVAKRPIQKGTSGDIIRTHPGYTKLVALPTRQVRPDAVFTPSTLAGKVAVKDIPAGQQLTAA